MLRTFALALALALSLALSLVFASCKINGEPIAAGASEMVLRAYDVPVGQAEELRNIVSALMWKGDDQPRLGNVVVAPTGQLLISAPPSFHEGVRQITAAMAAAPTSTPAAVAIDYWIVRGQPGEPKAGAADTRRQVGVGDDDVPKAARDAVGQLGGGMTLSLWDHTRITSIANERAEVQRKGALFEQVASIRGGVVNASLKVETDVGRIQLRTALVLDKPTVLIQASAPLPDSLGAVFYVVRASLAQ